MVKKKLGEVEEFNLFMSQVEKPFDWIKGH